MNDLQPLIDLLGGSSGKVATVLVWMGALRLCAKPISGWLQSLMTRLVLFVQGTPELDDDAFVTKVLKNPAYRALAFLVDWTTSIKLPTSDVLNPQGTSVVIKAVAAFAVLSILAGGVTGCGTLDKSGVYKGDKVLYDADMTIATSYDVIHTFVSWEFNNRKALASMPEVKQYADTVRRGSPQWIQSALAIRDAYQANPDDENRSALMRALSVLRASMSECTRYMTKTIAVETK